MSFRTFTIILLGPGAFYPPSYLDSCLPVLHDAGSNTVVATLLSFNLSSPQNAIHTADSTWLRKKYLTPLVETAARDGFLFVHSYGGIPGGLLLMASAKSLPS